MGRLCFSILELSPNDHDWSEYVQVIEAEGQATLAFAPIDEPSLRHYVMAKHSGRVVGFLIYEVSSPTVDYPLVVAGTTLTEAHIVAFGVQEAYRRRGIGRALQEHALNRAKALGCYQLRSISYGRENDRLKLAMGFAVIPDQRQLIFLMPLRTASKQPR